jgi:hypothetical protein
VSELQHAIFEMLTGKAIRAVEQLMASLGKSGIELTIARNRFYAASEDLAVLAARHLDLAIESA